jgi:leucyl-tRNA synthetase
MDNHLMENKDIAKNGKLLWKTTFVVERCAKKTWTRAFDVGATTNSLNTLASCIY